MMRINQVRNIDERINHKSFHILRPQLTLKILSTDQLIQQTNKKKNINACAGRTSQNTFLI